MQTNRGVELEVCLRASPAVNSSSNTSSCSQMGSSALWRSHIRDLGPLLSVHGLNVTYEIIPKSDPVRESKCSLLECSVAGHCYAKSDFSSYYCACFEGYFGEQCEYSSLCDPAKNLSQCDNGGKCRHIGSTAIRCECPKGFVGPLCQNRVAYDGNHTDCLEAECSGQCPFDGRHESVCNCPRGSKPATDRARFEGSIKLVNVTQIRNLLASATPPRTLEFALEKQLTKFMRTQNLSRLEEMKILNITEEGEVTFNFLGGKTDGAKVREGLIRLVERVRLGNLPLVPHRLSFRQEPALLLTSVVVNQERVMLGEDFTVSCIAQGSPLMEFRWYKDGALVNHSRATRHMWQRLLGRDSRESYTAILRVSGAAAEDDGELWCHVSDAGRQQCAAVRLRVAGTPPTASVRPKAVTLHKGENVSLVCMSPSERHQHPDRLGYFWTKNNALLPMVPGREVMEDLYPSGNILHIYNAQQSATYSCHLVSGAAGMAARPNSYSVRVAVVDPDSVPLCPAVMTWGVQWPRTAPGQKALVDCPSLPLLRPSVPASDGGPWAATKTAPPEALGWSSVEAVADPGGGGEAGRECVLKDVGVAKWEEPDFSECLYEPVVSIRDRFRRLTLGYETTTPVATLQQFSEFLFSRLSPARPDLMRDPFPPPPPPSSPPSYYPPPPLLPGEGEPGVDLLSEVHTYLSLGSTTRVAELAAASPIFFRGVDLLMRHRRAIKSFLKTTQLQSMVVRQSLLWAYSLMLTNKTSASYPAQFPLPPPAFTTVASSLPPSSSPSSSSSPPSTPTSTSHPGVTHYEDPSTILVYVAPLNRETSVDGRGIEYTLTYPNKSMSYPYWFTDKVQAFLTTKESLVAKNRSIRDLEEPEMEGKSLQWDNDTSSEGLLSSFAQPHVSPHQDIPSSWSIVVFRNLGLFLPQRYVGRSSDGQDIEYELGSRVISFEVGGQAGHKMHKAFQKTAHSVPLHPKRRQSQPVASTLTFNIEFSLTTPFPTPTPPTPDAPRRPYWNVTCGRLVTGGGAEINAAAPPSLRGHSWKMDACVATPSPAIAAAVASWVSGRYRAYLWGLDMEQSSGRSMVVTCKCERPGTYAVLLTMKKPARPWETDGEVRSGIIGEGSWWMLLPGYGGPPGARGVAGAGCGACLALSLLSLLSLLCLRPTVSLLVRCSGLCLGRRGKHQQANSSPSASRRLSPPPRPRRPRPCRFPSCLHLLKIQCCAAVVGAMAVFLYAMQASLPKSSYPYVTTCLEGFLLTGMSSHLSKVLIVYAEVVTAAGAAEVGAATAAAAVAAARTGGGEGSGEQRGAASPVVAPRMGAKSSLANLPRLSHLRPTILGIVTGLPVLAVLATHLSHHASGWDLPSWWLALGSSLFNVFLASASLISLLFAFLCASLLRRLRNLLVLITAPTRGPNGLTLTGAAEDGSIATRLENVQARGDVRIIRRRVAFLRRAAAIFSSMVVMETASVFYINIPDDVVTHYFFSISSALLGVVIFVCYVVRSEAPLGLCRLFRGGRRKRRVRGKKTSRRLRCGGEDNDEDEEEDEDEDDDSEDSDSSDSLDSPLTLSLKPDLGNEDSGYHGSLRKKVRGSGREWGQRGGGDGASTDTVLFSVTEGMREIGNKSGLELRGLDLGTQGVVMRGTDSVKLEIKTFKKQGSDPGTGETYIDANPLTDEELAVALAKKSLSLQTSGISLAHVTDQCVSNPAFDSADLVDAVLPYSEWKQREAGGTGRKPQRSNSCCGVAGRICAEEDEAEDERHKGICAADEVVVVKAQVEVNPPKSSLKSPKDSGVHKEGTEKCVAFSPSAKTPTTVRKSILKNPLPPKSVTILNPEPDVVEKEAPFPLVLDDLPPPITDPGMLTLNPVLSPEGYEGVTEPLQCPDVLDVPENRISMGVCPSVDPDRIVLTNEEVMRNTYPSVRVVPLATSSRPVPDNVPPAPPSKYSLYRSAGGTLGSKEMKIIEEEEEEDGEEAAGASSGPKPKDSIPATELSDKTLLDERVLQELRRRPEGREEGKGSVDEAFGQAKAEPAPTAAVNGDGDPGSEDLDGMLDRISSDLDYLLNRTPKHGTKVVGKDDVDLPDEMIALRTFEAPDPPPPDTENN
ncbi:uncharacterized protein LOC124167632 [Ischnura elegans]|uniref:uncharacterized protein LOC124167632 n=1 Tax=Ischnura elegans TaxID=197161 RepID=UPI001ED8A675|nr:uncharacterized protein LOC124167632 [Ischnura elegans]